MSALADRFAGAAETLVGTPFRLHGRDPASGIDCVGVIAVALELTGLTPAEPPAYRLRMTALGDIAALAAANGFAPASGAIQRGDLLLISPGPGQAHLMCAVSSTAVVHAHAALRRVVRQPIGVVPALLGHWRFAS